MQLVSNAAMKAGFAGGIYIDYPNSKSAKKYYLVISTAYEGKLKIVVKQEGEEDNEEQCKYLRNKKQKYIKKKNHKLKFQKNSKYWVYQKIERLQKKGIDIKNISKYSGRKRRIM